MIHEGLRRAGAQVDIEEMLVEFLGHYETNIAVESKPYPGAVVALEDLLEQGARLALCTNKREHLTCKLLQALKLDSYFHAIVGRDTFGVTKPDPRHLTGAIALAGGHLLRSVMVGDSDLDMVTARNAAVPSILVSFGYGPAPLDDAAPDAVIAQFAELRSTSMALLQAAGERAYRTTRDHSGMSD